ESHRPCKQPCLLATEILIRGRKVEHSAMAEERNPLHLPHHKEEDKEGEEKQHGHDHGHGHGHGHNHNHNQTEHAAGRGVDMDLPAYVNMGSFTTAGVLVRTVSRKQLSLLILTVCLRHSLTS
uniref:Uncharacterized protein n=1 Tax=Aegilops tauschii subsp. strangulata TaxID=200361 RepID=A0A453Q186_AEGTS